MKTMNIFKALAFAMLLTTACNIKDDVIDNEITNEKGYALPITLTATREGDDPATRATFDDGTKKLSFSTGDKLFVSFYDSNNSVGYVAGTLTWVSGGSFSGTLYTEHEYPGTALQLIEANSTNTSAFLLPNGYEGYNYFIFSDPNTYYATSGFNSENTFAGSKATAVEQFSRESASSYSNGFALSPQNAILSFSITGLTAGNDVTASLETGFKPISGTITADASGTATFAMGIDLAAAQPLTNYTLTVNSTTKFGLGERTFVAGHIYTVNRSMTADAAAVTTAPTATEGTIKSGSTTPLVTAGTAEGGTMMYQVTTANTKPTSTVEFSSTVPTAEGRTTGTYYVWYYARADASHKDGEISATAVTSTIAPPTLADALVSGAIVTVNFNYKGANSCTFTNKGDGTFAFNSGTGTVGNDNTCAKALIIDGNNIIFKQNWLGVMETRWDEFGFQVTFDSVHNTYSVWKGTDSYAQNASFTSLYVNDVNITSQLTKQ